MPLLVEDGTIVAGANTYVTLDEVKAFGTDRNITLLDDASLTGKIYDAMDWFEAKSFKWERADTTTPQELSFPRYGVEIDGVVFLETEIPPLVKKIIIQAALTAQTIDLRPEYAGSDTGQVKRKKLDVMEKEYFAATSEFSSRRPQLTKLDEMLAPLVGGLFSGRLDVRRV